MLPHLSWRGISGSPHLYREAVHSVPHHIVSINSRPNGAGEPTASKVCPRRSYAPILREAHALVKFYGAQKITNCHASRPRRNFLFARTSPVFSVTAGSRSRPPRDRTRAGEFPHDIGARGHTSMSFSPFRVCLSGLGLVAFSHLLNHLSHPACLRAQVDPAKNLVVLSGVVDWAGAGE